LNARLKTEVYALVTWSETKSQRRN